MCILAFYLEITMDSLTQIVLGAACGEAVLGKKIGNKALLFGAIGGTIPDLDVFVGNLIYKNKIDAMLFHRGFMHSVFFSIIAAFILGLFVYRLYNSGKRFGTTTQKDWILLWFLSLFTHPILDSFTPYGTQLFLPFSSYRVAFNNIAVVDFLYTIPFLICMILLMFFNRKNNKRRFWLKCGFILSSIYMFFTLVNTCYVNNIFKKSLKESGISYNRYFLQPSLFSNFLWYGIAETEASYVMGYYSLFDSQNRFIDMIELPKHNDLSSDDFKELKDLAWFSSNYYSIHNMNDGTYRYNDLRYPLLEDKNPNSAVFSFKLYKEGERLNMKPFERKPVDFGEIMSIIWLRIIGD